MFARACRGLPQYLANKRAFYAAHKASGDTAFAIGRTYPCLTDRHEEGGVASGQYFHQDLLVAQLLFAAGTRRHTDVGSRVDGFVAHVATFCEVEVLDIRPLTTDARNIRFRQHDLMTRDPALDACTDSLSCLHALEHFGLGRYGDPVDFYGHRKGFRNLVAMLRPGGTLYFSTPIGRRQRIEFDAHRVFSLPHLLAMFLEEELRVDGFHYVDDQGRLHTKQDCRSAAAQATFDLQLGCGIFELVKPAA